MISSKKRLCRFLEKAALRSVPRPANMAARHTPENKTADVTEFRQSLTDNDIR